MNSRRTRQNRQMGKVLSVVLLFVFSGVAEGCRNEENVAAPVQPTAFTLSLPMGTQFLYDTWWLDQAYYPQLPSTKTKTSWRVLSTGETYQGMSGVTIIADSASTGRDTLYLAPTSSGDLYIYGFLARLTKRRDRYDIPPRWDHVASFSAGSQSLWTVGVADSLGEDVVTGSVTSSSDYYTTVVDGVTEVFPTYRIDLTGRTLYYSLWFSSSPNAIVRFLEEPTYHSVGQLLELVTVKSGKQGSGTGGQGTE
jgi:hypothetical protein